MNNISIMENMLLGIAIGDALGVPVEFKSRQTLRDNPITGMVGYGTHYQPPGTWSDDTSLTFCLVENMLIHGNEQDLANRLIMWYDQGYWTAHGERFDVGITTARAIQLLKSGCEPVLAGRSRENSNGNGSLMRILPLAFFLKDHTPFERFEKVKAVSALTHAHIRSIFSCFICVELGIQLINGHSATEAVERMQSAVNLFLDQYHVIPEQEITCFERLLRAKPAEWAVIEEQHIASSGYVIHTLEASIWCLLTTTDFKSAVLRAVNLGDDTDTTGAVTGGLAGLLYGATQIPAEWLTSLARFSAILSLAEKCNHWTAIKAA